jgi:predicted porin
MCKKTILFMMVVTCFAVVSLQADETQKVEGKTEGPNLYGQANLSLDALDSGSNSSPYVSSNSSRLGVKGDKAINDDNNVIYQIEWQVWMDQSERGGTATAPLPSTVNQAFRLRNTFAGVATPYGTVRAGHFDTPFKVVGCNHGLFINRIGDFRNVVGVGGGGFNQRPDNVISYTTPTHSGLTGVVAYAAENGTPAGGIISGAVMYKNGPLKANAAYEDHGKGTTNGINSESGVRLAGTYTFGDFAVMGLFESLMDLAGVAGADRETYGGGVSYDAKVCTVKGQIFTTDGTDNVANSGGTMFVLGVDKKLTERTTLYAAYAETSNDSAATMGMSGGGHGDSVTPAAGFDPSGFSLGLHHKFP